jgi:uncharacterized repeat protein (TIGR03803 family)
VLYGTTCQSQYGAGTVFELSPPPPSGGPWTYTLLYSFGGYPSDGVDPYMGVLVGAGGVLFGSTGYGGSSNGGTLFSLTPPTSPGGDWTGAVLMDFPLVSSHNVWPVPLTLGENNTLYGTTQFGGALLVGTAYVLRHPLRQAAHGPRSCCTPSREATGQVRQVWRSAAAEFSMAQPAWAEHTAPEQCSR